jgi:hypothetical protein
MSRTYRRKNYELTQNSSWDRRFRRVLDAPADVHYQYTWFKETECYWYYRTELNIEYHDKRRLRHDLRRLHGDNHPWNWSPAKYWRQLFHREFRRHSNHEIHKFIKNSDYEPMCYKEYRPYWVDWY